MTPQTIPPPGPPAELYRLERSLIGERLVPVARLEDATHAGIGLLRRMMETHARETRELRAQVDRLHRRAGDLEGQLGRAVGRGEQAEARAAQHTEAAGQLRASVQRLVAKNGVLIDEKRRLRDALTGKHPLPHVHYRVDVDREETARESTVETLDTFPHREQVRAALAEARRIAERRGGHVRQVRLDTAAWRAVIQRVVEE